MRKASNLFLVVMVLPFVLMSCGNDIANQLKKEMRTIKSQCPQYQGNGVTMTDANFYENEKVLEYVASIEGVESIDDATVANMKQAIVSALSVEISAIESLSVKAVLKTYDYRYRYIYTDMEGNILCEIEISKYDFP